MAGFLQEHVLTRTVRDSAAILDCTQGHEIGDPYYAPPVEGAFLHEVSRDPGRLRIAMTTSDFLGSRPHRDCVQAVEVAAETLEELGHRVDDTAPPVPHALLDSALTIGAAFIAHDIDAHACRTGKSPNPDFLEAPIWALYEMGKRIAAPEYLAALTTIHAIARQIAQFMQAYDIWLSPVLDTPSERLGAPVAQDTHPLARLSYLLVANATGMPSVSLPLHWTDEGLPVGVMLTGRFGEDGGLFRVSGQLERARPWQGRRPLIWQ